MKVIIFGATGMIGQGVLREALLDSSVEKVLAVVRAPTGQQHPKLSELIHKDMLDFSPVEAQLAGYDTCLWCLGVSSAGMSEADYTRITYDFTMAAAAALLKANPALTFCFISGASTDANGKAMWARVKGRAENALLGMPFKGAYMFRPGIIQPLHGIKSRTPLYRAFYVVAGPMMGFARSRWPKYVTSTEQIGRAMLRVARDGAAKRVLETSDINTL